MSVPGIEFVQSSFRRVDESTRILVVDEFEPMLHVIKNHLLGMGVKQIATAQSGEEAMLYLATEPVDLVISDGKISAMTGLELLKAIRTKLALHHLPVMIITDEAQRELVLEAIQYDVSDLLVKPYSLHSFKVRVERAFSWIPRLKKVTYSSQGNPSNEANIKADEKPPSMQDVAGKPTILVVDDQPENILLLSSLFNDEYRVKIAHNGAKALQICMSAQPPDLVLLDVMMPGMDGFEVAERMREHPLSEKIPVIFVTAMNTDKARMKGLSLGAVDFVTKPIDPEVLKPRVKNFLRYVQLHKQLQLDFDAMQETARLRDEVEQMTRHDLKSPLIGMLALLKAVIENGNIGRKDTEQLRMVEEYALQILNMIHLSSELYKIETGRFRLIEKRVDLGVILRRIVDILRVTYRSKRLNIIVETDIVSIGEQVPCVKGDEIMCYSLFQNLIKCACDAAPENTQLSVVMFNEDPMRVIIRNRGTVPPELRDKYFEKYVSVEHTEETGLGAYSASLLAIAQNGSVQLTVSDEDCFTEVRVVLPRD